MSNSNPEIWYKLSNQKYNNLQFYFYILILVGIVLVVIALVYESYFQSLTLTTVAIIGGIGSALIGSSVYYTRKLYKAAINLTFKPPINTDDKMRELGILSYYYLRPLFSICFALLIHISIKSGVTIITVEETILDKGFIYVILFLSFFAGFGSGDILTLLESKKDKIISDTLN